MNEIVETSVFRRIRRVIDFAIEMEENAAIIGAAGVGKTTALSAYEYEGIKISRITIKKSTERSYRELLGEICQNLGMNTYSGQSPRDMERSIHKMYLWNQVILIDEAQLLSLDLLRQLLTFSPTDEGQLRFVFCGNEDVLKQINTDSGPLAQISRRVKFRDTIRAIDDEDSRALALSFGVEDQNAHETMRLIGRRFHTDGVVTVLKLAYRFADRKPIRQEHILDALDILPQYRTALEAKRGRRKSS